MRTATTVAGANLIKLSGTGATAASVKFTSPTTNVAGKVTLAVSVTSAAPAPTGKVTFTLDGKSVASSAISGGTASATIANLAAGTHTVVAEYTGDTYHPAAEATETLTVTE